MCGSNRAPSSPSGYFLAACHTRRTFQRLSILSSPSMVRKLVGDKKGSLSLPFLFTVALRQRSSAGAPDAKFTRFIPGPALCGPASRALYPDACQENASSRAQAGAGREPLPARCSSASLCARICHNFAKSRNIFRPHPFIHPFIQHSFIINEVSAGGGLW